MWILRGAVWILGGRLSGYWERACLDTEGGGSILRGYLDIERCCLDTERGRLDTERDSLDTGRGCLVNGRGCLDTWPVLSLPVMALPCQLRIKYRPISDVISVPAMSVYQPVSAMSVYQLQPAHKHI